MRVLVFGDSITQGFWDVESGGWVQRLRSGYDKESVKNPAAEYVAFFNLGLDGDTTESLLKRVANEIESRDSQERSVLIFATGANDTLYRDEEYDSTPEKYREQLSELLAKPALKNRKVLFVGLLPVIDELLQPMPWSSSGKCYSNNRMKTFNDVLVEFCHSKSLPCVDVFPAFSKIDLGSVLLDGIHPNEKGHQLIAELVKPELEKLLR